MNHLKLIFAVIFAFCIQLPSVSQVQTSAKVYTKKVLLKDFPNRTAKIVTNDTIPCNSEFKAEVSSRWRISPYEFCPEEKYGRLSTDNNYYFLHFITEDGIEFLSLDKGGIKKDPDTFKRPFNVIKVPIATAGKLSAREGVLIGALLDIIQNFVEEAMISDNIAYAGLTRYNRGSLKGRTIYFGEGDITDILREGRENTLAAISIVPAAVSEKSLCYRMLISADTHELFYYTRERFREGAVPDFNNEEIKMFSRRNAVIVR